MQVDNLVLVKCLGKGSFGEVYLTQKIGDNKYYATKKYEREKIKKSNLIKYLENEIKILQILDHPNIVKFGDIKKTKNHYYIVMEFCNGGELSKALEKYQSKYGKPFPEELVQYLMRQIISAFKYIHNQGIMHRDIKLENILLHYNDERDKKELNLMKAQIKIIDFGFACKINKNLKKYTAIGNPLNMDPIILKKLNSKGKKVRQLGYDQKADIWSLGSICYEMLIGRAVFDANDMDELVNKVETGKYKVPTNLSKEVISFLNGMLQYSSNIRLDINQLAIHQFITKNLKEFHRINLRQVSNKLDNTKRKIVIDVKKNRTIWAIFNKEDEEKLININGYLPPINEENESIKQQHGKYSPKKIQKMQMKMNDHPKTQDDNFKIKGINMNNMNNIININMFNQGYNNYNIPQIRNQGPNYGPILPYPIQIIPGNPMYQNSNMQKMQIPMGGATISTNPTTECEYICRGGIYNL